MRSEDFWLLARLERGSMAAAPCDRAKTQPKAKKTAARWGEPRGYRIWGKALKSRIEVVPTIKTNKDYGTQKCSRPDQTTSPQHARPPRRLRYPSAHAR